MSVRRVRLDLAARQFGASFRATRRLANATDERDGFWEATATLSTQKVGETRETWAARLTTSLEALPAAEMGFRMRLEVLDGIVTPVCQIIGGESSAAVEERAVPLREGGG